MKKTEKIWRAGRLVKAEVLRKADKKEGYGPSHFHIRYVGRIGLPVQEVVHRSLFR